MLRERLGAHAKINPPLPIGHLLDLAGAPRVTVIILSHNRPELLLGALHSVLCETPIPVRLAIMVWYS